MKILERFSPLKVPSSWKPIQKGQSLAFFFGSLDNRLVQSGCKTVVEKI